MKAIAHTFNSHTGLFMESYGEVVVSLQSISRGVEKMCLDWGQLR